VLTVNKAISPHRSEVASQGKEASVEDMEAVRDALVLTEVVDKTAAGNLDPWYFYQSKSSTVKGGEKR
jgi:uncharacterized protein YggE